MRYLYLQYFMFHLHFTKYNDNIFNKQHVFWKSVYEQNKFLLTV